MAEERELCDDCGKADSSGVPCALMFKKGVRSCTGYVCDPEGHARIMASREKAAAEKTGKKGGK